jgi:pimeloyl-ACP methyl ester carboxylesterase
MTRAIDDGRFIVVNGVEQWVAMRGRSRGTPAVLIVSGPGAALSRMAPFFAPWETNYTLVFWDQPGAGATYARNGDAGTGPITIDRLSADTVSIADSVRIALDVDQVVLLGISGGSIVGLHAVVRRPDLFAAYVGTGQFVHWRRQDRRSYQMLVDDARARGDAAAVRELEEIGPPPYESAAADAVKGKYAGALTPAEQAEFASLSAEDAAALRTPPAGAAYVADGMPPHDPRELAFRTYQQLRPDYLQFDASKITSGFSVPMVFIQGERDMYSPTEDVREFVDAIGAPRKALVVVEGGGHSCVFLRDRFLRATNEQLSPLR